MIIIEPSAVRVPGDDPADWAARIEQLARTCTGTVGRRSADPGRWVERRVLAGHDGVLEHVQASYRIVCSRSCSHQLVRHRMASYLQRSQRYTAEPPAGVRFVLPLGVQDPEIAAEIGAIYEAAERSYELLLSLGLPREDARCVLPAGTATELVATANLRSWRHFLGLRLDGHAQAEIRNIAGQIAADLRTVAPWALAGMPAFSC